MKEQSSKPLFGGYPLYKDRFPCDRIEYTVDTWSPPQTYLEAIDLVSFAALPDIVAYDGDSAYQQQLIWCAAAWLFGPGSSELRPESALQEFLDDDMRRSD